MIDHAFTQPITIGNLSIQGRLFRSGTSERGCDADGYPTEELRDLYVELAQGGCPLILTGFAYVRKDGQSSLTQNGIHTDQHVARWASITEDVHKANPDTRIVMQIVHGGRQCHPECVAQPLAPSAVFNTRTEITPWELTDYQILEIIESFAQAACRVKNAGFDAIQLHMAHGYLISQFLSPHTNRRTDDWGGNPAKRRRFALEVYSRVRETVGQDYPILAKINATDCIDGGLTPEESAEHCSVLADKGIDGIELSGWMVDANVALAPSRKVNPAPKDEGYFLDAFQAIRQAASLQIPMGICGGFRSAAMMNRMLTEEGWDFVSASRPFIAEPDLVNQFKAGQPRAICISCNACSDKSRKGIVKCHVRDELLPYRIRTNGGS